LVANNPASTSADATRAALTAYDARTLEDFAMMTVDDFEEMTITAARLSRPLPPLQQRKVAVLLDWVHEIVEDETPTCEKKAKERGIFSAFFDGTLYHSNLSTIKKLSEAMSPERKTADYSIIPPDWESRFEKDIPVLKKKLKLMGEESTHSLWANFFLDLRWILCGYKR